MDFSSILKKQGESLLPYGFCLHMLKRRSLAGAAMNPGLVEPFKPTVQISHYNNGQHVCYGEIYKLNKHIKVNDVILLVSWYFSNVGKSSSKYTLNTMRSPFPIKKTTKPEVPRFQATAICSKIIRQTFRTFCFGSLRHA